MSKFSVLTVGDCTIDIFLNIHEENAHCKLNKTDSNLCISYGEKIQVDPSEFLLGGIACNVTVGLSRLGIHTSFYAEIGDDEFSQKITNTLLQENIDVSHITKTPHSKSSFAIGINFQAERTLFVSHVNRKHSFNLEDVSSPFVFLAGLGEEWKGAYANVLEYVKKHNAKLALSLGSQQLQEGYESIAQTLKNTYLLFLNKEEAIRLVNNKTSDISELLKALQEYGPSIVVITDGKNGSYNIDEQKIIRSEKIQEVQVIEKTGAGDAYASGFLAAIIQGKSIEEAMQWGSINAASVIGKIGAQAGLLTKGGMASRL